MFRGVGRRLALFNALVVLVVIALTGIATYLLLLRQLDAEVDHSLMASAEQAVRTVKSTQPAATSGKSDDDDDEHHGDDILASGDTIVFAVDTSGRIIYNPRDISAEGVPVAASYQRALAGETDLRSLSVHDIGPVRVASVPIEEDHQILGAVQVLRSLDEHDAELATVRWMTLLGVALGAAIAVPAGLLLARRSMRPIDAAFERQRMFVADASHELRTPLTLIRANAEIAREEPTAPVSSIDPELANIVDEVDRTDRLVDDLLTLARADTGRLELRLDLVDLSELAREVTDEMLPLARQRQIDLRLDTPGPCLLLLDAGRIRQVLRILLDNALKYTPAAGHVEFSVSRDSGAARIIVRDSGPGIASEHLPRIFDRFYRVDQARSRAVEGTGLGLPIARALVNAHGGSIKLTSTVGEGTTVTVTLPTQTKLPDLPGLA
ncbi:MAG TPA: ATP-binding protein [Nitrolancea sp.]|nr:ATP-binding protein [Nitrolancea sp.]